MKPAPFIYVRPGSVAEMLELLRREGEAAKILAGGQSLVAAMNFRLARPAMLLDANGLTELASLRADADALRIGALTRHAAFHSPVMDGPMGYLLTRVARHIAHYPIRQRGTFGGSLAHADPAAEWCLVAVVLDATLALHSHYGERTVPAGQFFRGTFTTALRADELLTEIRLPDPSVDWRYGFNEFSRRVGDFALAMALAGLRLAEGGQITAARLGLGGVAEKPVRLAVLEQQMIGQRADVATFAAVADAAALSVTPSEDIHASAAFRRDLIRAVLGRALAEAAA